MRKTAVMAVAQSPMRSVYIRPIQANTRALALATPLVSHRLFTGKASPGHAGAPTRPRLVTRLQAPSGLSSRPSPPASLNALSRSVRSHLAAHPCTSSDADAAWVVDRLFALLLQPARGIHEVSPTAASPPALEPLHPLLCVRVLQRLGYAVWDSEAAGPACSTPHATASRRKGWSVRHAYPSLESGGGAVVTSATSLPSGSAASAICANTERVAGSVLAPLLPLLGDGTAAHPPHSQVRPVLPLIVEWLCTLPTAESTLPLDRWLPWIVTVYAADHRFWPPSQPFLLPPLLDLLPHLLGKLSVYLDDATTEKQGATRRTQEVLCERCLASLFAWSVARSEEAAGRTLGKYESEEGNEADGGATRSLARPAVSQGSGRALADVLWWHSEAPLLRLAGVRRALQVAQQTVPLPSIRVVAEPSRAPAATARNQFSTPVSLLQGGQECSCSPLQHVPHVIVALGDDDAFRRFLLRLAALQSISRAGAAASAPSELTPVLVSVQLTGSLRGAGAPRVTGPCCGHAPASPSEDPDMILRCIQPLHEYILLLQESSLTWSGREEQTGAAVAGSTAAVPPVKITFTGVVHVLMAIFSRLEVLKQQSSCRGAAAAADLSAHRGQGFLAEPTGRSVTAFVLLPHKARLHTLKRLCELLLRHARAAQASNAAPIAATSDTASLCTPWFADVELCQQEATLRRLCGAARALVRVVMEERRRSLTEEGPEGSVLTASSVAAAQQHRTASDLSGASSATAPAASTVSLERALRSLAFRVVEPALWRLHEVCVEAQTGAPLHVLSFEEWQSYLGAANAHAAARGSLAADLTSATAEHVNQVFRPVVECAVSLFRCVGGRAGLRTAQQVLLHPGQQSVSALVEGIRLTALQCLLFDGLRSGGAPSASSVALVRTREEAADYMDWVLHHVPDAFFSVWHQTMPSPALAAPPPAASEAAEAVAAGQQLLRYRLGLLTLLLHVRVLSARELLRRDAAPPRGADSSSWIMSGNAAHTLGCIGHLPSSLSSLLHCMTKDDAAPPVNGDARDEWSLVLSATTLQACVLPPPPAGCTALWELVEELRDLASTSAREEEALERPAAVVEWAWLGSPEALSEALDTSQPKSRSGESAAGVSPRQVYYLLPWTTLAHAHQPWRVYDESGQARRAAQEWVAMLHSWLTGSPPVDGGEAGPRRPRHSPVVRLVGMIEEVCFFHSMQRVSLLHLSADVRVVRSDVRKEERAVAPMVRRVLTALQASRAAALPSAEVAEGAGWYPEEEYDGLD
ncbi:hypothetical protein LSCM1_06766 [Leishmania martiniquensis]|uniref:Uncharacterized protein n=1 Tax=Leishmania martiniquensis TaxID=1580590 RepID=A0A836KX02_9TRYP|nr:hypothetical protein LSCM1_06766 [Leishmania martiniquensis]